MKTIRLSPDCSLLLRLFPRNSMLYREHSGFKNIVILAQERVTNYTIKKKAIIKRLLSLEFLQPQDRQTLIGLQKETKGDEYETVETYECDEVATEV